MNYDFTEQEFTFFIKLHELVTPYADEKAAALNDPDQSRAYLDPVLSLLALTPYLKLGIEPVAGTNGLITLMGAMEVVAAISPSLALSVGQSTHVFGRIISSWGNDAQKEKWLAPLLSGKLLGAVALSEDSLNIDNAPLETLGVKDGNFVTVNGRKQYVINAPIADWIAVAGNYERSPGDLHDRKEHAGPDRGSAQAHRGL